MVGALAIIGVLTLHCYAFAKVSEYDCNNKQMKVEGHCKAEKEEVLFKACGDSDFKKVNPNDVSRIKMACNSSPTFPTGEYPSGGSRSKAAAASKDSTIAIQIDFVSKQKAKYLYENETADLKRLNLDKLEEVVDKCKSKRPSEDGTQTMYVYFENQGRMAARLKSVHAPDILLKEMKDCIVEHFQ